ncbi:ribosome biogenesis GTP-binding protein YihA/YsxC [Alphaproteobacteria bacterium]|nr:ribosome biogenesis GTP-binding protein YihA/YsxC [Alphaproteobacteria bacterium]
MFYEEADIENARKLFSGECNFIAAALNEEAIPPQEVNEIAFAGRSNVGKSSLVNALTNRKTLARTSQTPGRTRQLIFFDLIYQSLRLRLVDLPGYGYAKAPKKDIHSWTTLTVKYLKGRPSLRTVCLLVDSRRGIGDYDRLIMKELDLAAVSWVLVLTKADKLKNDELTKVKDETNKIISKHPASYPELKGAVSQLSSTIEERLGNFGSSLGNSISQQTQNTQKSLMEMHARLEVIDRAQENISSLSNQVNDLQNILSNKQLRGAFGEVQLENIVKDALPQNAYKFQYTLTSNSRVDCIVKMPDPPGSICIDSKFPLEDYKKFASATNDQDKKENLKLFHNAVQKHIKDIAEKYILPGETADSAIMFLPSESIYSEINIRFPKLVNESRNKKVYMAGPDNLMLLLHTVRAILRDATMSQTAGKIQIEVDKLINDLNLLSERIFKLDKHFDLARKDLDDIKISHRKIENRGSVITSIDVNDKKRIN